MLQGKFVFSQIMEPVPWKRFQTCINRYSGDYRVKELKCSDYLNYLAGAYYIMDRGYLDFERLYKLNQSKSFFATRTKKNTKLKRYYSTPVDKSTGVQCDQVVVLASANSYKLYPETFRRIRFYDAIREKRLVFITNNMMLPTKTIADLYKSRWRVELFFKWIKQHLRIKTFYGVSENVVKSQIWIGICVYLLAAIMKKKLNLTQSLYQILQVLSLTQFEKMPILSLFEKGTCKSNVTQSHKPLTLFDL